MIVVRGDKNDGRMARLLPTADLFRRLEAVQAGQAHVQQHDREVLVEQQAQSLLAGSSLDQLAPRVFQGGLQDGEVDRLVVHQEDLHLRLGWHDRNGRGIVGHSC